jgi:hypothetical protein
MKEENKKELLSPAWYAVGSVAAVPVVSATLILSGLLLLIALPAIPLLMYMGRKAELIKISCASTIPKGDGDADISINSTCDATDLSVAEFMNCMANSGQDYAGDAATKTSGIATDGDK